MNAKETKLFIARTPWEFFWQYNRLIYDRDIDVMRWRFDNREKRGNRRYLLKLNI